MKRKFKKSLIASLTILALGGTATSVVVASSMNKDRPVAVKNHQVLDFKDNIDQYIEKAQKHELTVFDAQSKIGLYQAIPSKACNEIYKPIFSKINKDLITNDLFSFLNWTKESYSNSVFKYKILDFKINSSIENNEPKYQIEIVFDIYNPEPMASTFTLDQNNTVNNTVFGVNEIKSSKLVIDSKAIPFFHHQIKTANIADLYAGYYFDNAHWIIGDK